jgi:hypothetical protein
LQIASQVGNGSVLRLGTVGAPGVDDAIDVVGAGDVQAREQHDGFDLRLTLLGASPTTPY